jgi:SpoIIAA-like
MLERIAQLPDGVLGFTAKGTVTAADYESALIPAVEDAIARHQRIRLLYHLGEEFTGFEAGALWDDAKIGLRHRGAWERIAVVTDVRWVRDAVQVLRFVIPGEIRLFHDRELPAAREWLSG